VASLEEYEGTEVLVVGHTDSTGENAYNQTLSERRADSARTFLIGAGLDASRVRAVDEEYWGRFGTTPKAFVPPQVARALWRTRYGSASSVQVAPADGIALAEAQNAMENRLRERVTPPLLGIAVRDVAADARALGDAAGRDVSGLTWLVMPLVLACLCAAVIGCAGRWPGTPTAHVYV